MRPVLEPHQLAQRLCGPLVVAGRDDPSVTRAGVAPFGVRAALAVVQVDRAGPLARRTFTFDKTHSVSLAALLIAVKRLP